MWKIGKLIVLLLGGGSANLNSHYGEQFEDSLKKN